MIESNLDTENSILHIHPMSSLAQPDFVNLAEHLAAHFVSAKIKRFHSGELEAAKQWITSGE